MYTNNRTYRFLEIIRWLFKAAIHYITLKSKQMLKHYASYTYRFCEWLQRKTTGHLTLNGWGSHTTKHSSCSKHNKLTQKTCALVRRCMTNQNHMCFKIALNIKYVWNPLTEWNHYINKNRLCPSNTTWFSVKSINADWPQTADWLWHSATRVDSSRQKVRAKNTSTKVV